MSNRVIGAALYWSGRADAAQELAADLEAAGPLTPTQRRIIRHMAEHASKRHHDALEAQRDDLAAALREYDDDGDALADDLEAIAERLEGRDA